MRSSRYSLMSEAYLKIYEGKRGLWDNIHAKRKRGEKPAKPGDKDYPETLNVEETEQVDEGSLKQARKNVGADTCWDGYKAKGTKMKGGKSVPNCVKEDYIEYLLDNRFAHNLESAEVIYTHMSDKWKNSIQEDAMGKTMAMLKKKYGHDPEANKKAKKERMRNQPKAVSKSSLKGPKMSMDKAMGYGMGKYQGD